MAILINRDRDLCRIRGRDWAALPRRQRQMLVKRSFHYWRRRGFPYFDLSAKQIAAEFQRLQEQDTAAAFHSDGLVGSVVGLRLANHFQPHMWAVRVSRYLSPMDVFQNDDLLPAALERSWRIWPDRLGANASNLRRMLKTYPSAAGVSNFRPTLARAVIDRFSPEGGTVLDFCAGFGGRLVGSLTLNRHYIGIEPCVEQCDGLRRTCDALKHHKAPNAGGTLHQGCAEDVLPRMPSRIADLVFSSPPYYDWERYSTDKTQSFIRYQSYEEWLEGFLDCVIVESHRILKPRGRLILNLPRRRRLPTQEDVESLASGVGFRRREAIPLLLARVPYLHPRRSGPFKSELLVVFEKR